MSLSHNEALEKCGFILSGGKWRKQLDEIYTLFQQNGQRGWSVDIVREENVVTESAGKMKGQPIYERIQAELQAIDDMITSGDEQEELVQCPDEHQVIDQAKAPEEKDQKWSKPAPKKQQTTKQESLPIPIDVRGKQIAELTMEDVKKYICPLATDQEIYLFLKLCQARGLNPFLNEVYLIKYGNEAAQTVVAKETFTRKAEQNQFVDGFEAGIMVRNENGEIEYRPGTFWMKGEAILGGWAKVYRTDKKYPYEAQVPYQEFEGKKKDGTVTKFWRTMPATMIRKVALVQALREALPSELSGLYDFSEISSGSIIEAEYTGGD